MAKYRCKICGYIYDDEKEKVKFEDLPDDWTCPLCGESKEMFELVHTEEKAVSQENSRKQDVFGKAEYRCRVCGYVYEEEKLNFGNLSSDSKCPLCGICKNTFEHGDEIDREIYRDIDSSATEYQAVTIFDDNPSIERVDGCINCGICKRTCLEREGMRDDEECEICVGCGQCIITCPKRVLQPRNDIWKFLKAKKDGKICVAYTSPGVRVSIGDGFGYPVGEFLAEKLVGVLRQIGFEYVFDVTFGADLTIMEESSELIDRIQKQKNLPMITSCCPAWVSYAEIFYPDLLDHISTCKSPIGMQGIMTKKYFSKIQGLNEEDIFTVAITPCTAKKQEIVREGVEGTDVVITVSELIDYLKAFSIDLRNVKDSSFDDLLSNGSGSGVIFGNTGGVMEAALRETAYMLTKEKLSDCTFEEVRGYHGVKSATVKIGDIEVKVAVIDEMKNALAILDSIRNASCEFDFIEIMNCRGGCIGGGGQPIYKMNMEKEVKEHRIQSLYQKDEMCKWRYAHENPDIIKAYDNFLEKPNSKVAHQLLHTVYSDKSYVLKEKIKN